MTHRVRRFPTYAPLIRSLVNLQLLRLAAEASSFVGQEKLILNSPLRGCLRSFFLGRLARDLFAQSRHAVGYAGSLIFSFGFFLTLAYSHETGINSICNDAASSLLTILKEKAIRVSFPLDLTMHPGISHYGALNEENRKALLSLHTWGVLQQVSTAELRPGVVLIPKNSTLAFLVREVTQKTDGSIDVLISMIASSEVKSPQQNEAKPSSSRNTRMADVLVKPLKTIHHNIRRFFDHTSDVFLVSVVRAQSVHTPFRIAHQPQASSVDQKIYVIHPSVIHSSEQTLQGHTDWVRSASFSPNGSRIVTASDDRTAKIWNTQNGELIDTLIGHTDWVRSASFSPDGSRIVTASDDRTVKIWNDQNGKLIYTINGHTARVSFAVFSPDGSRIITTSSDKTARVWNAQTFDLAYTIIIDHADRINSATFSPDGSRMITITNNGIMDIWNAQTGQAIFSVIEPTFSLTSATFSPDGSRIISTSNNKTATLRDAPSGETIITLNGHSDRVVFASFSPDGFCIITASDDHTVKIWDAQTGRLIYTLIGHTYGINSAVFSRDGSRLVTASYHDRTIRIWTVPPYIPWDQE